MLRWLRVAGLIGAGSAFGLLGVEHFLPQSGNLLPVEDHWLSEYVLSSSPTAALLMKLAFLALGMTAACVGLLQREAWDKGLFLIGGIGLATMAFCDTYPNDGGKYPMQWPPTAGNWHQ